uniref:Si:ch73-250a16.5 n=1 Tax=Sinocyclocheilus grahami TaxID=75366 RepID=A0A672RDH3_SINGR
MSTAGLLPDEAVSRSADSPCGSNRTKTACVSVLAALVLGVGVLCALAAGPLHAQCFIEWKIGIPCFDVSSLLVNQIKEWSTETCPGKSQRCLYSLVSVNAEDITATHTTPVMRFVDDITFNLSSPDPDSCDIQGRSVSQSWYAILDSGTNYLNMYNLMRGSGLSSSPSFTESTSDRLCTQFTSTRQKLPP